jgi:ComF family protein
VVSLRFPKVALGARFREAVDALASLVFPAPCRICGAILDTASRIPICEACRDSLRPLSGPHCEICGRPFVSPRAGPKCHACRRDVYGFDVARSYGAYDEGMVRAILLLKYEGVRPLGRWFAARLAGIVAGQSEEFAADVVVPVPLHPARLRERGYNQAELIARPLARRLGLPLRSYLLVRTKPRPEKLRLTRHERWETVRGAYALRQGAQVDNLRVLLVDDVMTTGATLDACSRALRKAGASRVACLTVARVISNWAKPDLDW